MISLLETHYSMKTKANNIIYLIYDDECLLCRHTAKALRIKKAVGKLVTIDARTDHPLVTEVNKKGFDLNKGIIVKYNNDIYFGTEALHLLAMLSSPVGLFNRMNAFIFKYKFLVRLCYPFFKMLRNILLFLRRTPPIYQQTEKPIFAYVFANNWQSMPEIFKIRYGNFAFRQQSIKVKGKLNIFMSRYYSCLKPFLRLTGALVPCQGQNIPVTVEFNTKLDSATIFMNRTFNFQNQKPYSFNSRLLVMKTGEVIELMRFGLGVSFNYCYENNKILLIQRRYIWRICGFNLRLPLTFLLGKVTAHEMMISNTSFAMLVTITHPLFGKLFEYDGEFELI